MKRFFLSIYYFFRNFFKRITFRKFERKLQGALVDKHRYQIVLMKEIKTEINNLYPKSRSKFIPLSLPQRIEIRAKIYSKFAEKMRILNVNIDVNLKFT